MISGTNRLYANLGAAGEDLHSFLAQCGEVLIILIEISIAH